MRPEALQPVALAVAQERSLDVVLARIAQGLAGQPGVALARVWLLAPGDICDRCHVRSECPDQTRCLRLVARAGRPTRSPEDWSRLDGDFRRVPLNVRKVGRIGATGEGILIKEVADDTAWIARPEWALREGIRSFAGHPLLFRDEVLGVLAVFTRTPLDEDAFTWLRVFADHAAVAIAHSRAFEEIRRLGEQLALENTYLREDARAVAGGIIGGSAPLQKTLEQIALVAPTDTSVLVLGESGTGKELVAQAIHDQSRRRERPLIRVNCGAIPRDLFESEFFGHVKGAFTGAFRDRVGRFQAADGGTLFLDEIGEIPLELQPKLLGAVQEGEYERVGEDRTRHVDVRLVAATNRDLAREIAAGRFREDLYYRLSVFLIEVPPLRQRKDDIADLAEHFLRKSARTLNRRGLRLTREHVRQLARYDWPGNVRELRNVIERASIIARAGALRFDLPPAPDIDDLSRPGAAPSAHAPGVILSAAEMKRQERENIAAALRRTEGRIYGRDGAARLLGLKPTTLLSRLVKLGLKPKRQVPPA
jgi:transcriptional regulator with GAF, ATPase, and Fis domain